MAKFTFNMPDVGEGVAEAEIVEWMVKVGDTVQAHVTVQELVAEKKFAVLKTECTVNGKAVLTGEATIMVPSRTA